MKGKDKESDKKVEKKSERVTLDISIADRAKGVRLPSGNPTIVAVGDGSKVPTYLREEWDKIEKGGKDGVKINTIAPPGTGHGRVSRWHVRTLCNPKLGLCKAVPEPGSEKKPKDLMAAAKKKAAKKSVGQKRSAGASENSGAKAHAKAA